MYYGTAVLGAKMEARQKAHCMCGTVIKSLLDRLTVIEIHI